MQRNTPSNRIRLKRRRKWIILWPHPILKSSIKDIEGEVMKRLSYEPLFIHLLKTFIRDQKSKNEIADSKQKNSNIEEIREKDKRSEVMNE